MYKYSFPFTITDLHIFSEKSINEKILDRLSLITKELLFELNHKLVDSSAYRFNDAKKGTLVMLNDHFIKFLELNIKYQLLYPKTYKALKSNEKFNLEKDLVVKKDFIQKEKDIVLDSNILRKSLILEVVDNLLIQNNIKKFLISTNDSKIARGKKDFSISFEIDSKVVFKTKIQNSSIIMLYNSDFTKENNLEDKFANKDVLLPNKYSIVQDKTITTANLIALQIKPLYLRSKYLFFVEETKHPFLIIDSENKPHEFKPIM